jgi:cysteine synthase
VVPENVSQEKIESLRILGANVVITPQVAMNDPRHFQNLAARLADENRGFYANQFFNSDNPLAHYRTTGPEIFEQSNGEIDGFICATGTGGSFCGISRYLKQVKPSVACYVL